MFIAPAIIRKNSGECRPSRAINISSLAGLSLLLPVFLVFFLFPVAYLARPSGLALPENSLIFSGKTGLLTLS